MCLWKKPAHLLTVDTRSDNQGGGIGDQGLKLHRPVGQMIYQTDEAYTIEASTITNAIFFWGGVLIIVTA